jgi:pyruvate formate lyase activating enzyme
VHKPFPIYDVTPFSLLDYPEYPSAIIWFAGCNMQCQYCYNPDIVFSKGKQSIKETLDFLKRRQGLLEGVVLSGGEATEYHGLQKFCESVKALGYKIKLDTNGINTTMIKSLLEAKLIDFIALDYKAPRSKFYEISKNRNFNNFEDTLNYLFTCKANFEVRTTLHSDLLDEEDINSIIDDLANRGYANTYYIQKFQTGIATINNLQTPTKNFDKNMLSKALHVEFRSFSST